MIIRFLDRFPVPTFAAMVILFWTAVVSLFVLFASGCATFTTSIGPQVAKGVTRYCEEPQSERLLIREQVNGLIAPNTIKVTCAGDAPGSAP